MVNVPKLFGSLTFNERVMKDRLPAKTFRTFRKMVEEGLPLTRELADMMAYAMKDWALENGCTHFTHWFQPMTGITAEKHDSFIAPAADGLRERSDPERAGRVQLPVRRSARHL